MNVIHKVEDFVNILKSCIKKILEWKAFKDQIKVRFFLEVLNIIHRWVKNFMKLSRLLT